MGREEESNRQVNAIPLPRNGRVYSLRKTLEDTEGRELRRSLGKAQGVEQETGSAVLSGAFRALGEAWPGVKNNLWGWKGPCVLQESERRGRQMLQLSFLFKRQFQFCVYPQIIPNQLSVDIKN